MSDNLNVINLVGRLGRNPEVKIFVESGASLAKCPLAVNRNRKKDDEPDWFDLTFWGKLAEIVTNYTSKGSLIAVTGEFKLEEWVDSSTGRTRSKPVVNVTNLELLSSKSDQQQPAQSSISSSAAVNSKDF
ncbi:MAG: single-stranded DNA-binding protein [Hydrococcus sp. CRU_1_1]|nr:single-stranded DNA-binding protein [Hydrococcus sp. CRU_1_1]